MKNLLDSYTVQRILIKRFLIFLFYFYNVKPYILLKVQEYFYYIRL